MFFATDIQKPFSHDPGADSLHELGVRHEQAFLRHLAQTKEVVQIPGKPWEDAVARTVEPIRRGADVVYQATFQDGPWGGRVLSLYLLGGVMPDTFEESDGWICFEKGRRPPPTGAE